jgi:aryl-alcohol dehydrogenase-like predicted oxidoreductase
VTARLPTVDFGRTGLRITRVGIGAWAFGGAGWVDSWGSQDDAESIAAIRHAAERGVNWIDTAPIYGLGHAEEVVGRALRRIPPADRPYVFTKAGVIWDPGRPRDKPTLVGDPASIRAELEASLRRLGVERIDLYQMHAPPTDGTPIEAYWQVFCDLRAEGKVRAIGLSNHDVARLEAADAVGRVDSVQPKFNLLDRAEADVLSWCASRGAGAIVYSPMASGLLTGRFTAERAATLPADDWRRGHRDFAAEAVARSQPVVSALRTVADRHGVPVAAVAVAWTLAFPGVSGAIVGVRRADHVGGWLAAASLELDEDDFVEIAAAVEHSGAGSGPTYPFRGGE